MKSFIFLSILIMISIGCEQESEEVIYSEKEDKEYPYSAEHEQVLTDHSWAGNYVGYIPDNECREIKIQLNLSKDFTFTQISNCSARKQEQISQSGNFEWDKTQNLITLNDSASSQFRIYKDYIIYLNPRAEIEENKKIRFKKIDD